MSMRKVEGVEIPYTLDRITELDPNLVGVATLFKHLKNETTVARRFEGRIRDLLVLDFRSRRPEEYPELIMYSGVVAHNT